MTTSASHVLSRSKLRINPFAAVRRRRWGVVMANVGHDLLRRTNMVAGQIGSTANTAREASEIPGLLDRSRQTARMFVEYGALTPEILADATVLELGCGDNLGVALRFIAMGARRVVAFDKFVPLHEDPFHVRLYRELRAELTAAEQGRIDSAISIEHTLRLAPSRLDHVFGVGLEDTGGVVRHVDRADVIVSNAVLEEIYDIEAAFRTMDAVLAPGGVMIHKIDLRDYGMFVKHGFHPLEFLTIPDGIYRLMTEASGQPNRRLIDSYRDRAAAMGYRSDIFVTWVHGGTDELSPYRTVLRPGVDYSAEALSLVERIRPRLLERYRALPGEDLLVGGILLVARKPV